MGTSPPAVCLTSLPRSSCRTTPDRCPTATLLCLIATPRTLPASSPRSWRRLTGVPESLQRTLPSSSSLVTPPSSSSSQASLCALSPSPSSLLFVRGRIGFGLRPGLRNLGLCLKCLARLPRQQRRPTRRSEILFWGNLGILDLPIPTPVVLKINFKLNPLNFTLRAAGCIRPGSSWLLLFFHPKEEPRICLQQHP